MLMAAANAAAKLVLACVPTAHSSTFVPIGSSDNSIVYLVVDHEHASVLIILVRTASQSVLLCSSHTTCIL